MGLGIGVGLKFQYIRSVRGRWITGAVVVVLVACVAGLLSVARLAEARVKQRLARLDLDWSAGDASAGWRGLSFEDVSITHAGSKLLFARSVQVELAWLRALGDPKAAVRSVVVSDVVAQASVTQLAELRARQADKASGESTAPEAPASTPLPPVRASKLRFALNDAQGPLVQVSANALELSAVDWRAEIDSLELGNASDDLVVLEGVRASGPFEGRRPRLQHGEAATAMVAWRERRGDDATNGRGLVGRLRSVRTALRSKVEASDEPETKRSRLWTSDARLELKSARVLESDGSKQQPILERLHIELAAEGEQFLRVKGDGVTATGGSLQWNLQVAPSDAKLEGRVALREVPLALFAPALPKLPFYELERTRVGADLAITGRGLESASVRGELSIRDLGFESERIARAPVGPISFTARGQGTWTPARRELSDLKGEVISGQARVLVTGALAWPADGYHVELRAELPKTKCESVLAVVPPGILDELASIQLGGDVKAKLDVLVDAANLDATKLDFDIQDKCKFIALPEAMNTKRFERSFTHRVLEPEGEMFEMETGPGTPAWTPIELISPFMIQAVVAHEDGRFFNHHGFAETEIGAALARNLKARAFKFGASTITMQLVKNVFLHRDKLLSRKFQEALIVWWLEQQVDKRWILELYLNVIEYGTSIYGIRNAALHYFGTLPIHLTPAQAAFLGTILPSPKSYDEQYAKGYPSESTKSRVVTFLKHMRSRDRIDDDALAFGLEEIAQMRFYNPDQPPPVPSVQRGSALAPPWQVGTQGGTSDGVSTFEQRSIKLEDGAFGF